MSEDVEDESEAPSRVYPICTCTDDIREKNVISERKMRVLGIVTRTENYLRERRIPELIKYLLTKVLAESSSHPVAYIEKLLDACMLFRAGHGSAPVIYEEKHLKAILRSFDPGQRGWLSAGQTRRAFAVIGLVLEEPLEEKYQTSEVLQMLKNAQEDELFALLSAGYEKQNGTLSSSSSAATTIVNWDNKGHK